MFDKRLLQFEYPLVGRAFVENGKRHQVGFVLDGWRRSGHWVEGVAHSVYKVGETPFWVKFYDRQGIEYVIEHSCQFEPRENV